MKCAARIAREMEALAPDGETPLEPLGNGLCRLRLRHPAVRAAIEGDCPEPGTEVRARLRSADVAARRVEFALAP